MFEPEKNSGSQNSPSATPPGEQDPFGAPPLDDDGPDFAEERAFEPDKPALVSKFKLARTNILLGALFLASAMTIYGLSLRGGPRKASANEEAIEKQVKTFLEKADSAKPAPEADDGKMDETRRIIESFYNYASRRQVPLEGLRHNPFAFGSTSKDVVETGLDSELLKQIEQANREFAGMKLQSVLINPRGNSAIVNNNILSVGDTIGRFAVQKIEKNRVVLGWGEQTFDLMLSR